MQQIIAHGVHHRLFRLALLRKMGIVPRVKDMISAFGFDDTTCENKKVLLLYTTTRKHLTMLDEMDEILCAHLLPRSALAMPLWITPVVEIKEVVLAILIERYKVPSPGPVWIVENTTHWLLHPLIEFKLLEFSIAIIKIPPHFGSSQEYRRGC